MPGLATQVERYSVLIAIGGVAVRVNTSDADFLAMLEERYAGFVSGEALAEFDFDVELAAPAFADPDADVSVTHRAGRWFMERGDFRAEWDPAARRGWITQSANPYSIDAVLRIVHTLVLARQGGFLLHSASAVRNGKAFLFAGVSGAGKTTISRLAPADATLLTDEISYVRKVDGRLRCVRDAFHRGTGEAGREYFGTVSRTLSAGAGSGESYRFGGCVRCGARATRQYAFFCWRSRNGSQGISGGVRLRG